MEGRERGREWNGRDGGAHPGFLPGLTPGPTGLHPWTPVVDFCPPDSLAYSPLQMETPAAAIECQSLSAFLSTQKLNKHPMKCDAQLA